MELSIQERLKDLRVERGLTLEQLEEQVNLSKSALGSYIPFFRCGTEYIDLLLIRAVGIQAGAELEIRSIVRAQLATVRGTVGTFASGDHMVHGVLNMAQNFVSLVAHLVSPRFSSGAIRSL